MAPVRWLTRIDAPSPAVRRIQNETADRFKSAAGDDGDPVTGIAHGLCWLPPGWPDLMTRERFVHARSVPISGRAWSGAAPVTRVEVGTDGGLTWADAELAPAEAAHPFAWRSWGHPWDAGPGPAELAVRATDGPGIAQPVDRTGICRAWPATWCSACR